MVTVAVDAMGGDDAPRAVVEGAAQASVDSDLQILLVGAEEQISEFMNSRSSEPTRRKSSWRLLLATALAAGPDKYDSIRVICRKEPTPATHLGQRGAQATSQRIQTDTPTVQRSAPH